jgi:hypothetical protein
LSQPAKLNFASNFGDEAMQLGAMENKHVVQAFLLGVPMKRSQ